MATTEKSSFNYCANKTGMSHTLLKKLAFSDSPLIYNKIGFRTFCLICKIEIQGGEFEHARSEKKQHASFKNLEELYLYHSHFLRWSQYLQKMRIFLLPSAYSVTCVLCSQNVLYKCVANHIPCTVVRKDHQYYDPTVSYPLPKWQKRHYTLKRVEYISFNKEYYPPHLIDYCSDTCIKAPVLQVCQDGLWCLICLVRIGDTNTDEDRILHLETTTHKTWELDIGKLRGLTSYHLYFQTTKTLSELDYHPHSSNKMICKKCKQFVNFQTALRHPSQCSGNEQKQNIQSAAVQPVITTLEDKDMAGGVQRMREQWQQFMQAINSSSHQVTKGEHSAEVQKIHKKYQQYLRNPNSHPDYKTEERQFIANKCLEAGINSAAINHEIVEEFKKTWILTIQKLCRDELDKAANETKPESETSALTDFVPMDSTKVPCTGDSSDVAIANNTEVSKQIINSDLPTNEQNNPGSMNKIKTETNQQNDNEPSEIKHEPSVDASDLILNNIDITVEPTFQLSETDCKTSAKEELPEQVIKSEVDHETIQVKQEVVAENECSASTQPNIKTEPPATSELDTKLSLKQDEQLTKNETVDIKCEENAGSDYETVFSVETVVMDDSFEIDKDIEDSTVYIISDDDENNEDHKIAERIENNAKQIRLDRLLRASKLTINDKGDRSAKITCVIEDKIAGSAIAQVVEESKCDMIKSQTSITTRKKLLPPMEFKPNELRTVTLGASRKEEVIRTVSLSDPKRRHTKFEYRTRNNIVLGKDDENNIYRYTNRLENTRYRYIRNIECTEDNNEKTQQQSEKDSDSGRRNFDRRTRKSEEREFNNKYEKDNDGKRNYDRRTRKSEEREFSNKYEKDNDSKRNYDRRIRKSEEREFSNKYGKDNDGRRPYDRHTRKSEEREFRKDNDGRRNYDRRTRKSEEDDSDDQNSRKSKEFDHKFHGKGRDERYRRYSKLSEDRGYPGKHLEKENYEKNHHRLPRRSEDREINDIDRKGEIKRYGYTQERKSSRETKIYNEGSASDEITDERALKKYEKRKRRKIIDSDADGSDARDSEVYKRRKNGKNNDAVSSKSDIETEEAEEIKCTPAKAKSSKLFKESREVVYREDSDNESYDLRNHLKKKIESQIESKVVVRRKSKIDDFVGNPLDDYVNDTYAELKKITSTDLDPADLRHKVTSKNQRDIELMPYDETDDIPVARYSLEKIKRDLTKIKRKLKSRYENYKIYPEQYPYYNSEWTAFYIKRSIELKVQKINVKDHDFKPEWMTYWLDRMDAQRKTEWKQVFNDYLKTHVDSEHMDTILLDLESSKRSHKVSQEKPAPSIEEIVIKKPVSFAIKSVTKPSASIVKPDTEAFEVVSAAPETQSPEQEAEAESPDPPESNEEAAEADDNESVISVTTSDKLFEDVSDEDPFDDVSDATVAIEESNKSSPSESSVDKPHDSKGSEEELDNQDSTQDPFAAVSDIESEEENEDSSTTPTKKKQIDESRNKESSPEPNEFNTTVVEVLRILCAFENRLDSLGPTVIKLLSVALVMERKQQHSSDSLLDDEDNLILFQTVSEKLKSQLRLRLVQEGSEYAYRSMIKKLDFLVNLAEKNSRLKEKFGIDRAAIAREVSAYTLVQSKRDLTAEQVELLVDEVVRLKTEQMETNKQAQVKHLAQTHDSSASNRTPRTTANVASGNLVNISDSDIITLLQNFNELPTDEQAGISMVLQKLMVAEPERLKRIREIVDLKEERSFVETPKTETSPYDPFAMSLGEYNTPRSYDNSYDNSQRNTIPPMNHSGQFVQVNVYTGVNHGNVMPQNASHGNYYDVAGSSQGGPTSSSNKRRLDYYGYEDFDSRSKMPRNESDSNFF